jgi:hypothetical protein
MIFYYGAFIIKENVLDEKLKFMISKFALFLHGIISLQEQRLVYWSPKTVFVSNEVIKPICTHAPSLNTIS